MPCPAWGGIIPALPLSPATSWVMSQWPLQWGREQERDSQRSCLVGSPKTPFSCLSLFQPPGPPAPALRGSGSQMLWPASLLPMPFAPQSSPSALTWNKPRQSLLHFPRLLKRPSFPWNPRAGRPQLPFGGRGFSKRERNGFLGRGRVLYMYEIGLLVIREALRHQPPAVAVFQT